MGVITFRLYSIPVRCRNTRFRDQLWGDFLLFWRGMADSAGCERNLFARDVLRPIVAYLQNLNKIEKIISPYTCGSGFLRHAL